MTSPQPQPVFEALASQIREISATAMPALVAPTINTTLAAQVPAWCKTLSSDLPHAAADDVHALHAGLWLLADDLSTAHTICQDIPTSFGSAWHAVMHRREGDFSNSKYWWRRASGITWQSNLGGHDPAHFVDLVEQNYRQPDPARTPLLLQTQRLEWLSLFLENLHHAKTAR